MRRKKRFPCNEARGERGRRAATCAEQDHVTVGPPPPVRRCNHFTSPSKLRQLPEILVQTQDKTRFRSSGPLFWRMNCSRVENPIRNIDTPLFIFTEQSNQSSQEAPPPLARLKKTRLKKFQAYSGRERQSLPRIRTLNLSHSSYGRHPIQSPHEPRFSLRSSSYFHPHLSEEKKEEKKKKPPISHFHSLVSPSHP